jgi:hypothetical protein
MQTNKTLTIAFAFTSSDRRRESNSARIARLILDPITLTAATHVAR